jgi:hypothetical protein
MFDRFGNPMLEMAETCQSHLEEDVVEVPFLLPGWQVSALETAAHQRGQTAAQMVRNLVRDFLREARPGSV